MIPHNEPTDLAGTDYRIALLENALSRQQEHITRLNREGLSTTVATTVLHAGESVLQSLRAYRKLLLLIPTR